MELEDLTIHHYPVDGFEIYALKDGHLVKHRFIDFSVDEAIKIFLEKYGD